MSIASNEEPGLELPPQAARKEEPVDISERKARHLEICVEEHRYDVETADTGFSALRFLHRSLPEIDADAVDTRMRFLDYDISVPLLISCMTGGSAEGTLVNNRLAEAAQRARVPVGMGSIRILFRDERYFEQFALKRLAPDVPVIANLSAIQLRDLEHGRILETLKRLEVQALAVHLNAGQELFQPGGDRDFRGLKEAISRFCERSALPVIVKETGFGMRPSEIDYLLEAGVAYVDLAGAGGTNWARVESYRLPEAKARIARELDDWGFPTAVLMAALRARADSSQGGGSYAGKLIASGGIRSGSAVAKSLALGAELTGVALPFARAVYSGGVDAVLEEIARIAEGLRAVMTLTGSATLAQLRAQRLLVDPAFVAATEQLLAADAASSTTSGQ